MTKYRIEVTEVLSRIVETDAEIPRGARLFDTALGARHHEHYSTFKNHPARGGFVFRMLS